MKVLFLDVDGVLNCGWRWKGPWAEHLDKECLANLFWVVNQTGCHIVVSSTWRLFKDDCCGLLPVLNDLGVGDKVIGKTKELNTWRCVEIQEWLSQHPEVIKFAIVDDDNDAQIEGNFFQTSFVQGLTTEIAEQIVSHLNGV